MKCLNRHRPSPEGVETEGQAEMLKRWGCDQVQGFYYGKPEAELQESEQSPSTARSLPRDLAWSCRLRRSRLERVSA